MESKKPHDLFGTIPIQDPNESAVQPPGQKLTPRDKTDEKKRDGGHSTPDANKGKKQRPNKIKWLFLAAFALLAGYLFLGFLGVPFYFKSILAGQIHAATGRSVTIGSANFNPFTLTLTLRNGIMGPVESDPTDVVDPVLSFGSLVADMEFASAFKRGLICKKILLDQVFIHLVREKEASYNLTKIIADAMGSTEPSDAILNSGASPYSLNNISITNSRVLFDDLPAGKKHSIDDIALDIPSLSSLSFRADEYINPKFSAVINGSPIALTGTTNIDGNTFETRLDVKLSGINMVDYFSYIPAHFNFSATKGTADLIFHLVFISDSTAGTKLSIEGSGTLKDLWLSGMKGKEMASVPLAKITGSFSPLDNRYHLEEVSLHTPRMILERMPDGNIIFPRILSASAPQKNKGTGKTGRFAPPYFTVGRLVVTGGRVSFTDQFVPGGFAASFSDLNLSLTSDPSKPDKNLKYAFNCKDDKETGISAQGDMRLNSLESEGILVLDRINFARFRAYMDPPRGQRLHSAVAKKLQTRYFIKNNGGINFSFRDIDANIENITLRSHENQMLHFPLLTILGGEIDFAKKHLNAGSTAGSKGKIHLSWGEDGTLDWSIFNASREDKGWSFEFQNLEIAENTLVIENRSRKKARPLVFEDFRIKAEKSSDTEPGNMMITAASRETGNMELNGTFGLAPFSADFNSRFHDIKIARISPYLFQWFLPQINSGVIDAEGSVSIPAGSFNGRASIHTFAAGPEKNPLVTVDSADSQKLSITFKPLSVKADTLSLVNPFLSLTIFQNGGSSLLKFFQDSTPPDISPGNLEFGTISIKSGHIDFIDQGVTPLFSGRFSGISGMVTNLTNNHGNRANFSLSGNMLPSSPIKIAGSVGFFDDMVYADFSAEAESLDLPPLSLYLKTHLGNGIPKGFLDLDLTYRQQQGEIHGDNNIRIYGLPPAKQLKSNSNLPMATALHSDEEGIIALDIPVTGRTDDDSFSYRGSITRHFRSILLKAGISPFALLSSLAPLNLPLDHIIFNPGETVILEEGEIILRQLQKIMKERPQLTLGIKGFADGQKDREAMDRIIERGEIRRNNKLARRIASGYGQEEIITPSPDDTTVGIKTATTDAALKTLASARAKTVRDHLSKGADLQPDRLFIIDDPVVVPPGSPGRSGTRVDFTLAF